MPNRFKLLIMIAVLAVFTGCAGSSEPKVATADFPSKGYQEEIAAYQAALEARKPSPSLWTEGSHGTIFLDYKARLVGDVVIVRIVETASANNSNQTSTSKSSNYDASIDNILGLPLNLGANNFLGMGNEFSPTIAAGTGNNFNGNGNKVRSDSISATIAARVIEVLPSGNLVIEGQREIVVDQEKQTLTLRGIVRQKDITAANEVASTAIADAQITYSGDGVITDANRKGWLSNIIDWVWPF